MKPEIYSYRRVSSLRQIEGVSLELQSDQKILTELSKEFNLPISNQSFSDAGKSAYKGEHLNTKTGELAFFIAAIKKGEIASGSILCVYSLDRLSRQSLGYAKQTYLDITNAGVNIYSMLDKHLYKAHDASAEILSTIIFERANNESKEKSARTLGTAKKRALDHQNGVRTDDGYAYYISLGNAPWWVAYRDDKAVIPDPIYWNIAKEVHQLILNGFGNNRILEHLNKNYQPPKTRTNAKHPDRRTEWKYSTIANFHKQKALFGQRTSNISNQQFVLDGYYPALMTEDEWHIVQNIKQKRNYKGNRKRYSLVTGLGIAKCIHCGAVIASGSCSDTNNTRFYCAGRRNLQNGCKGFSFTGWWFEKILLHTLVDDLFIENDFDTDSIDDEITLLHASKKRLEEKQKKIFQLFEQDQEGITPDFVKQQFQTIHSELNEIDKKIDVLSNNLKEIQVKQNVFNETAEQLFNHVQSINQQIAEAIDENNQELRKTLRTKIQKVVKSIEMGCFNEVMYFRIILNNGLVRYAIQPKAKRKTVYCVSDFKNDNVLKGMRSEVPSKQPIMMLPNFKKGYKKAA